MVLIIDGPWEDEIRCAYKIDHTTSILEREQDLIEKTEDGLWLYNRLIYIPTTL